MKMCKTGNVAVGMGRSGNELRLSGLKPWTIATTITGRDCGSRGHFLADIRDNYFDRELYELAGENKPLVVVAVDPTDIVQRPFNWQAIPGLRAQNERHDL